LKTCSLPSSLLFLSHSILNSHSSICNSPRHIQN
jgi:hypothetical protein